MTSIQVAMKSGGADLFHQYLCPFLFVRGWRLIVGELHNLLSTADGSGQGLKLKLKSLSAPGLKSSSAPGSCGKRASLLVKTTVGTGGSSDVPGGCQGV